MTKKHIAALAAILLFAATGAEAQTAGKWKTRDAEAFEPSGVWEISWSTDEWGDPDPTGNNLVRQIERTMLTIGGRWKYVEAILVVICALGTDGEIGAGITFMKGQPNLEEDLNVENYWDNGFNKYKIPFKIDGTKGRVEMAYSREIDHRVIAFVNKDDWIEAKESLEILFAWGRDGHRQSLTWSMAGLSEAFAEACGEELDAERE